MISANEALERLRRGNQRFVSGQANRTIHDDLSRREELVEDQNPFAIVLGCSDSRVPAELVFDQGLGDLFVIRVAGNIVMPSQIGSVEFAVQQFGTPLVVILGHTRCGAVIATLDELEQPSVGRSPNLRMIVNAIRPSLQDLFDGGRPDGRDKLVRAAVRQNIRASVEKLSHGSDIIEEMRREGRLRVVGAEYALETGCVEFFQPNPP